MLPSALYDQRLRAHALEPDPAQTEALLPLDRLAEAFLARPRPFIARLMGPVSLYGRKQPLPRSLYLYGPVGRGKSMLMDLLVEAVGSSAKVRRQHFHQFMRETHQRLARARAAGAADPLALVAADLIATVPLLCFDELFVRDVADAMILARLFTLLAEHGVAIVFTSNCAPAQLYAGGLQRARFLPFIELLQKRFDIVAIAGPADHRQGHLAATGAYLTPLGVETTVRLHGLFKQLIQGALAGPYPLLVEGRVLTLQCAAAGVLFTSFAELCEAPLGPADMLELAATFQTVLLDGVPQLSGVETRNATTRFITLIDALYDARRRLVIAAAASADALYAEGPLAFEFRRAASRLAEMQSADWPPPQQAAL